MNKVNLDLTFLREASDVAHLAPPDVIAQEIVDELEGALAEFSALAESLKALRFAHEESPESN